MIKEEGHPMLNHKRTFGQKAADSLTKYAGSWVFIMVFMIFIILWMIINSYMFIQSLNKNIFDPYPFILLNLVLSCFAAIQAPIILMSQNREEHRDRIKAEYDYLINKKAEREIREIKEILLKHIRESKKV